MKVVIEPGPSDDILATVAVGNSYYQPWEKHALPGWAAYCRHHGLGLIVFDKDQIPQEHETWKNAKWQKLLIAQTLAQSGLRVNNVCYLDSDILINHTAPNIFDFYYPEMIGLVSQINNLKQPLHWTLRRLAFLRHTCYDNRYPLDSALFMSPQQVFEFHDLPVQSDYACTGLIVFNVANHAAVMKSWFDKYDRHVETLTGGGEEPHLNFEIQNWGKICWLPYEFQALWVYEIAWKYPFLYSYGKDNLELIRACIEASLYANHFLHFAGSWHESKMWKVGNIFADAEQRQLNAFMDYLATPVTGQPKGIIKP